MMLSVLFRRRRMMFYIFSTIVLATAAYLFITTPKYESAAQLIVRFGDRSIPQVDRTTPIELTPADRREIVLANADVLQSPDLLRATIETVGVETIYPDIVADPPSSWSVMDEAVRELSRNVAVDVGLQDNVITVALLHPDQALAPKIVQTMIDLYVAKEAQLYRDPQVHFQRDVLTAAEQRLAGAQAALDGFKAKFAITDIDQEIIALLKQRGDVQNALSAAQAELAQASQRGKDILRAMESVPQTLAGTPGSDKYHSMDDAQARLSDLRTKQSQMLATYAPDSPAMAQLKAAIATAEREVGARRAEVGERSAGSPNTVYQTLQTQYLQTAAEASSRVEPVAIYTSELAAIDARLAVLQQARGPFTEAQRQLAVADDTFRSLYHQYEDAQMKSALNSQRISNAAVLNAPTHPYKAARPRKLISLVVSIAAAVLLALAGMLLAEAVDDRLVEPGQLATVLGVPVLATLKQRR